MRQAVIQAVTLFVLAASTAVVLREAVRYRRAQRTPERRRGDATQREVERAVERAESGGEQ